MKVDEETKRIYVRQSWLGDMTICPERARLGQVRPDLRTGSDATIIGTAVHLGIEQFLDGHVDTLADMQNVALAEFNRLDVLPHKVTNIIADEIPGYIGSMCEAWHRDIMPEINGGVEVGCGGATELFFQVNMHMEVEGYAVWLEGTMDYIGADGTIWDWKTAKKPYYMAEKQKSAIQPTVYNYAAHKLGLISDGDTAFKYGVMIRQLTPKGQVGTVMRGAASRSWLEHYVRGAVTMGLKTGKENIWLMNDTSPLCSENWCSFWSICKGSFGCH